MADSDTGIGATLTKKVGPLPLWIWLAGGGLLIWYYEKQQSSSSTASTGASTTAGTTLVTDPAGNTCTAVDPVTGYCPGTPQDTAALAALQGATSSTSDTGSSTTTGATDTSGANSSGAPTGGPSTTPPAVSSPPVTTTSPTAPAASGSTAANASWSYPAPSGLQAYDVASNGYRLSWNAVKGPSGQAPSGYTVATYNASGQEVDSFTTQAGNTNTAEYGKGGSGLPKGTYHSNVWANGGPKAPNHATVTVTLKG